MSLNHRFYEFTAMLWLASTMGLAQAATRPVAEINLDFSEVRFALSPTRPGASGMSVGWHDSVARFDLTTSGSGYSSEESTWTSGSSGSQSSTSAPGSLLNHYSNGFLSYTSLQLRLNALEAPDPFAKGEYRFTTEFTVSPYTAVIVTARFHADLITYGPSGYHTSGGFQSLMRIDDTEYIEEMPLTDADTRTHIDSDYTFYLRNDTGQTHSYSWLTAATVTAAVPEPHTYALMLAGVLTLGMLRRRAGVRMPPVHDKGSKR